MQATVFNIQKFSIHDGPGIRTTVFLKGCPLRCLWCHNPESNEAAPELMFYPNLCRGCSACAAACSRGSIRISEQMIARTDRSICVACGNCVEACPAKAREIAGDLRTPEQVMQEIRKDAAFYRTSGGGMTVSGGEPMMQAAFTRALCDLAREEGIHTAVETCGFASWETARLVYEGVDLILHDIKHMDSQRHRELTGVPNEMILSNLRGAAMELKKPIWLRLPLIAGCNDDEAQIQAVLDFIAPFSEQIEQVWLLPYHNLGLSKLESLEQSTERQSQFRAPDEDQLQVLQSMFTSAGYCTKIG